jgi:hypothetical protein
MVSLEKESVNPNSDLFFVERVFRFESEFGFSHHERPFLFQALRVCALGFCKTLLLKAHNTVSSQTDSQTQ